MQINNRNQMDDFINSLSIDREKNLSKPRAALTLNTPSKSFTTQTIKKKNNKYHNLSVLIALFAIEIVSCTLMFLVASLIE